MMKYLFTPMLLIAMNFAKAQVVQIPDSNFKHYLLYRHPYQVIDINYDGEIQESEAAAVTEMNIIDYSDSLIRDITGIKSFKNITTLQVPNSLAFLDITGMTKLRTLLALTLHSYLTSFKIDSCSSLKSVNVRVDMDSLCPVGVDSLEYISFDFSRIRSIDLRNCRNLVSIGIDNSTVQYINLSNLKKATAFSTTVADSLKWVDVSGCSNIASIYLSIPNLSFLNLAGCTNLKYFSIWNGALKELDFSTCYNLSTLSIFSWGLEKLNLKNGTECRFDLLSTSNTFLNICADDFEIPLIKSYYTANSPESLQQVNISSYCTLFPGGNFNTISGQARLAPDGNGCDNTNHPMPNVFVKMTDTSGNSTTLVTGQSGSYAYYPPGGSFTISPYFPYPYFTVNPASATVVFDTANNLLDTTNFCIQPNGVHNDLEITFLPNWPQARPGFNAAYILVYKNRGTTTLSGNITVNFDNDKMNFASATENVAAQSTGQLTWNYNNLQPFESRTIYVTFNLLPPPVNNIGDTLVYLTAITPSANDETPFDNSFVLPQRIIGSYDPNDKQCLEGSKVDISKIGDYLHYQVRFQNEGTDTAFNIVVADTLSDKLDWNTFEFIGSSHSCNPSLKNNKAEFVFENIHLPYKAINEPASHGWVAFKIKPKPSVVIGDSLNNSAAIYFDFNLPVITNTATTIVSSSSTPVPVKLEYFSVNQKNNTNVINWKASCTYGSASFVIERSDDGVHFKGIGNITATALRCQLPFNFTDKNPVAGKNYYRLKITDADGKSFYGKTIVVGNNKAGIEITAVVNNLVYLNSNKQQTIQMKVIAADGKEILNQKLTVAAGNNNIHLQTKNTAKGVYTLFIYTNEGETITKRFIK